MCGLVGVASIAPLANLGWIATASKLLTPRGPDEFGQWCSDDSRVAFAHRRLSIVDLSAAGHQPMGCEAGNLRIIFNGEIYNHNDLRVQLTRLDHSFVSSTDTEVILVAYRQWGEDCVNRFNGMFAFAIYDEELQKIFIARDRVGEKPFFYVLGGGVIRFASELKALMADKSMPRKINHEALDCYLAMGFVPGELCILDGVHKLPAAHAMTFSIESGKSRIWRYWKLPEAPSATKINEAEESCLLDDLENLLEDSVRIQLAADVPVGVLLSGGVDSSLITAFATRAKSDIKTFTIRFPGYGKYDESNHARLISNYFGTEHIELNAAETTADLLPLLARQYDEPIVDSSMIPTYLVSRLIREHCTVALGGDGGDELFGGYAHYSRLLRVENMIKYVPQVIRGGIVQISNHILPAGFKGRAWLQALGEDWIAGLPLIASYFDPILRKRLMGRGLQWRIAAEDIRKSRIPQTPDLLQRATRMDFENYLPEDILVKVDRASMFNSLEIRAPFLDYRVIEFAFGRVPSYLKATANDKKILLKRLTQRLLPPEFDRRRKQGFSIPLSGWLQAGTFHDLFHQVLLDKDCIFSEDVVRELLMGQKNGMQNSERLFALVIFELWRREYEVSL
jgi:asparagine synthase (glutamine-hydrolysing)